VNLVETLFDDLRYGLRLFLRSRAFTVVAVLTLALGIGANTAIFSVVNGVVFAPLPYRDPDRLVFVWLYNLALKSPTALSYPDFLDWQRSARSIQEMAAFTRQDYDLTSPGTPEHLTGKRASSGFFRVLGVMMAFGREFTANEDQHGGAAVIVISNHLWRDRFSSSPAILGKSVTLGGGDYTVVGVLPPGFRFGDEYADVYTPLGQGDPVELNDRTAHNVACIARLKREVSIGQAQAQMNTIQKNLDQLYPSEEKGQETKIVPLKQQLVGDVRATLLLLMGAVGVVLLIACANVANLLLARSAARTREFAIRSALGANRARIVRQLITESLILSLVGGGLGLTAAKLGLIALIAEIPGRLPRNENIDVNVSALLFTLGVSIAVGMLFGLAPALKSSNLNVQDALKEGSRGSTSAHHHAQNTLVIVQMALTLVLLAGAGMLFRSIRHLWEVNPGFDAKQLITFKVGLSPSVTKTGSSVRIAYQHLLERIRQMPGVEAADLTTLVPLSHQINAVPFWVGSQEPASIAQAPRALAYSTASDYLRAMGIPLIRGRFISQADTINSTRVAVIDSVLANRYFPNEDPLGQKITFAHFGDYRIVGVVGHVRHWELGNSSPFTENQVYGAFYQIPDQTMSVMDTWTTVVVRTPLDTAAVMPAIKAAVYGAGSDQVVYNIQTLRAIVAESMTPQRLPMILLGAFATLALLLAFVGIYGLISYSVTQRVHEIGIRMALGAEKRDVFRMVVGQGLQLALAGVAIGGVSALILARLLSSYSQLLYGVGTRDPLTFAAVSVLLTAVAVLACYVPARRATHVDPMVALRHR
jgi:predicted permease